MKTQLILKTAVVAMAAFGAYAFSGSKNANSFRVLDGEDCRDLIVNCSDTGDQMCKVLTLKGEYQVWSDTDCKIPVYHVNSTPLPEL